MGFQWKQIHSLIILLHIADGYGTPNSNPRTPLGSDRQSISSLQYDISDDDVSPNEQKNPSPSKNPVFQRKLSRVDNEGSPSSAVNLPESPRKGSKYPDSTRCSITFDRSPRPNNDLSRCIYISIPLIFFMIALCYYCYLPINSTPLKVGNARKIDIEEKLVGELVQIQGQFPVQAMDVWRVSMGAIGSILREDPEQPAVLLLIGANTPESDKTINCLARKLANTVNKLYNKSVDAVFNVRDVIRQGQGPEEVKEAVGCEPFWRNLVRWLSVTFKSFQPRPLCCSMATVITSWLHSKTGRSFWPFSSTPSLYKRKGSASCGCRIKQTDYCDVYGTKSWVRTSLPHSYHVWPTTP